MGFKFNVVSGSLAQPTESLTMQHAYIDAFCEQNQANGRRRYSSWQSLSFLIPCWMTNMLRYCWCKTSCIKLVKVILISISFHHVYDYPRRYHDVHHVSYSFHEFSIRFHQFPKCFKGFSQYLQHLPSASPQTMAPGELEGRHWPLPFTSKHGRDIHLWHFVAVKRYMI